MHDALQAALAQSGLTRDIPPDAAQWPAFLRRLNAVYEQQALLYDALLRHGDDAVVVLDLDLNIVIANTQAAQLFQQPSPAAMFGKHASDYLSAAEWAEAQDIMQALLANEVIAPHRRIITLPDGIPHILSVTVALIRDEHDQPRYIQIIMRDISEQARAEEELAHQRFHLQMVMEEAPVTLWSCDTDGKIQLGMGKGLNALNLDPEQCIGKSVFEMYRAHPQVLAALRRALAGEASDRVIEIDGTSFDSRYRPLWRAGVVDGIVGVCIDITALMETRRALERTQQSAERHRRFVESILNSSSDGLIVTDAAGRIQQYNPAFEELFAHNIEDLFNQPIVELFDAQDQHLVETCFRIVVDEHRAQRFEVQAVRENQTRFYADAVLSPIIQDGALTGVVCTVRDVSLHKAMERSLAVARDQALEASRLKSEFLAMMSHEVRTPLHVIIGIAEMLRDDPLSTDQRELIDMVHEQATELFDLLAGILDYSKLEAGKMTLDVRPFDLPALIGQVMDEAKVRAKGKALAFHTLLDPQIPALLVADAARLRQILRILLDNAVKFTPAGQITLAATHIRQHQQAITLRLSVRDTGIGIAPQALKTLFEPFVQADSSHTRQYGGTGLGLAIASRLLALMHSELDVTSAAGGGSCFAFTLTLATAPSTTRPPTA